LNLQQSFALLRERYKVPPRKKYDSLESFFRLRKKGSKAFRSILENSPINILTEKNVRTFIRLIAVPLPDPEIIAHFLSTWGLGCLPNKIRDFGFKFFNNTLGINSRVAHFNNNVSEDCTFCRVSGLLPAPRESFIHLFYECTKTKVLIDYLLATWFADLNFTSDLEKRNFIFLGVLPVNNDNKLCL
jgi:hypothetical protein